MGVICFLFLGTVSDRRSLRNTNAMRLVIARKGALHAEPTGLSGEGRPCVLHTLPLSQSEDTRRCANTEFGPPVSLRT